MLDHECERPLNDRADLFSKLQGARLSIVGTDVATGRREMTNQTGVPGPGWHPDPWFSGQHRYWDGRSWTGDVFPDGPVGTYGAPQVTLRPEGERPPVAPPTARSAVAPPPPTWGFAAGAPAPTAVFTPWETLEPPATERRRLTSWQISAIALTVGLVVGFAVVAKVIAGAGHKPIAEAVPTLPTVPTVPTAPASPSPSPAASTPVSSDPSAPLLQRLVVRQPDVPSSNSVELLDGGNQVSGQTTLDLCNGRFPSEALRTARLQVVEYDGASVGVLSTEAVLYRHSPDAAQAMREVRSVAAKCPDAPVVSPVNEPTVTTRFQAAPDRSWPSVGGVERLAFAFTTTDASGLTEQHVAVYLHRGRVLEGVYFPAPAGTQPAVDGQTSIAGIVDVFAKRIAALPASAVSG